MKPRHSIVNLIDRSDLQNSDAGRRLPDVDTRGSLLVIKENAQGRERAGSRARTGSRVRSASRVRGVSVSKSPSAGAAVGQESKLRAQMVKANREKIKMKKENERLLKLEKEREEELKEAKETIEKMNAEITTKTTDLQAENQMLQEKLKKSEKGLQDLKSSTLSTSESQKIIQDLETQLMEKAGQLSREREARRNLERTSSTKPDSSHIVQELETKLMEKSNELKKEKESRERAEEEVKKLRIRIEEEKTEIGSVAGIARKKGPSVSTTKKVTEEKADEKFDAEQRALEIAMQLMEDANEERKKKKKEKKRRKKRRKKTADGSGGLPSLSAASSTDDTRKAKTKRASGLPRRGLMDRASSMREREEKIPPLTMSELTGISERTVDSLAPLSEGERADHILKVWLLMMLSIVHQEAKGKHKLIPLSLYFNFHSELKEEEQTSMNIVKMFGVLDNANNGFISSRELATFFKQVREVDALKWGWHDSVLDQELTLPFLIELFEVSFMVSRATFVELDVDKDGEISIYDLITFLKEWGGRNWWNVGASFGDEAVVEILMRVHRMKWGQEFAVTEEFDENEPPPVNEEEFNWYLVQHNIGSAFVEITDEFLLTHPQDRDRFNVFEHIVPGWKKIFKLYSKPRDKRHRGLTAEGAQTIVKYLRSSVDDENPKVRENDQALLYLTGLAPKQMEMMVRACPDKIWETLIDPMYQEPAVDREEEFKVLKQTIAEALILMSDEPVYEEVDEKSGEEVYVKVAYDDEDDAPWKRNNNMGNYDEEPDDPNWGNRSWV